MFFVPESGIHVCDGLLEVSFQVCGFCSRRGVPILHEINLEANKAIPKVRGRVNMRRK